MKKIKELILENALNLFNKEGYLNVSIRQIASATGISHSNLIYHYKTRQDIASALHHQLLEHAKNLHDDTQNNFNFMDALFHSTQKGFYILYDYRFFMIDLKHILAENNPLKQEYLQLGNLRKEMYQNAINSAVEEGFFREEYYPGEYSYLIEQIKIYSDSWITSSTIYDTGTPEKIVTKYAGLLIRMFYPYCTEKGRESFSGFNL